MALPTLDQIIFPEQANHNFSRILGDLKRANLSISNRLNSICHDAAFVNDVADALKLPLVANERCGSWYIDPARKAASAYFKSTDGHTGQWKFSTRRLNLQLLELIGEHDGCIIVDSTRRGKRMPDALSKTVPTWCAVLNRALFPSESAALTPPPPPPPHDHDALSTPPDAVSPSEASQMTALLPSFVSSLLSLRLDLAPLRQKLAKPLRPVWITPPPGDGGGNGYDSPTEANLLAVAVEEVEEVRRAGFHPVVCCTASRRVAGAGTEMVAGGYIQGAGDDTENWARGLTAGVFWRWRAELLAATEGDLPGLIAELVEREERETEGEGKDGGVREVVEVEGRGVVFVGRLGARVEEEEGACVVRLVPEVTDREGWVKGERCLEVGIGKGKGASRVLRDALPKICEFVLAYLRRPEVGEDDGAPRKVVVLCESGKDLSVGIALAGYCWCFDDEGRVRLGDGEVSFNKAAIRVRLGHIVTAYPEANPNRATLQSVNSFLMDWRK
ncbi:initiator tRNA phosphoribosyl transferase [Parathielavia hyrcaniae]|uniref:Initiator tRNA phosphoribosyl transferase n=1 Tax=Parathielavia hyrcaniae TaxID=113614 RepID=A0AAN6Q5H5_9PEZI|nr:initiator tRNA phosphoribosyl transferase [Parathielavia hyrcaniae]